MSAPNLSYAQRYEDIHLLRCFRDQTAGFYIDIGAGHPIYDNVSFAFYLRGWSGITVEPNSWLTQLSEAVRPRDRRIQSLVGAARGEATYYLVEEFHGLSTTIESNARAAQSEYGKPSQALRMPVITLRELCELHTPDTVDFLKIDVEGAERDVLAGGDWRRFRPKVVVLEALAPVTLTPSWEAWEPLLSDHDYRFAFFDGLNRYYIASEYGALAERLAAAPASFEGIKQFRNFKPALDDPSHPDHGLAWLLAGEDMVRLPLWSPERTVERLTAGIEATALNRTAGPADLATVYQRLFAEPPPRDWAAALKLGRDVSVRGLYERLVVSEAFRAACGRISASIAW